MFQALATLFTFGARQSMTAAALPISPMQVHAKRMDGRRQRQPSLECMWQADRATGRLESHWMALQSFETPAINAGSSLNFHSFSAEQRVIRAEIASA